MDEMGKPRDDAPERRSEAARGAVRTRWAGRSGTDAQVEPIDPRSSQDTDGATGPFDRSPPDRSWELTMAHRHLALVVTDPIDVDDWDTLFEEIVEERVRGTSLVVLPVDIPTTAGLGDALNQALGKNLRQEGFTVVRAG